MKHLYLLLLLAVAGWQIPLDAQGLRIGLKAGAGWSNLHFTPGAAAQADEMEYADVWYDVPDRFSLTGFLGAVLEYDLTKNFLVAAGLQATPRFAHVVYQPDDVYTLDYRLRLYYLQAPITVHYRRGRFLAGAGMYYGFCAFGNWKRLETYQYPQNNQIVRDKASGDIVFGSEDGANLRRSDLGLRGELGMSFKTWRLSLIYDHGLLNNAPVSGAVPSELRHRAVSATLSYYWLAKS